MAHIISVFGSSRPVDGDSEYRSAYDLGRELALAGFIVCNGGYAGIMESSARGAKEAGGSTIGVTSEYFRRPPNPWVEREIRVPSFAERLLKLVEIGQAYVILKGGTGTLLELACVWEFINKGVVPEKPIVVVGPFWKDVIATLKGELLWEGAGDCTRYISQADSPQSAAVILRQKLG